MLYQLWILLTLINVLIEKINWRQKRLLLYAYVWTYVSMNETHFSVFCGKKVVVSLIKTRRWWPHKGFQPPKLHSNWGILLKHHHQLKKSLKRWRKKSVSAEKTSITEWVRLKTTSYIHYIHTHVHMYTRLVKSLQSNKSKIHLSAFQHFLRLGKILRKRLKIRAAET